MLAWSEELITDVRNQRNHGYDVIVGGELFTDYSDHPRNLSRATKTQPQAPDATSFFPVMGCSSKGIPERLLSENNASIVADCGAWRFTYD